MRAPIRTGRLIINLENRTAAVGGQLLPLAGREYAVLELLAVHKGSPVMKEMLLEHLYGEIDNARIKTLRVFVANLRRKIALATGGEYLIETVGRQGYLLCDLVE